MSPTKSEAWLAEYRLLDPGHLEQRFFAREGDFLTEFGAGCEVVESRIFNGLKMRRTLSDPDNLPDADQCRCADAQNQSMQEPGWISAVEFSLPDHSRQIPDQAHFTGFSDLGQIGGGL